MVFGVVRNLVVRILSGTTFIDRFVRGKRPPEHKILLSNSAPVPINAAVVRREEKKHEEKQENDIVQNVTVAEEAHTTRRL